MDYDCCIIYGGQPVFSDPTTASSIKQAEMFTWQKYMDRTGYPGIVPIFKKNKIDQGYSCKCVQIIPKQPPNEPPNKVERYQPNLFEKQLDTALGIYYTYKNDT